MSSVVAATIGGVVFGSYLLSSYPSVGGGDSGELLAEACVRVNFIILILSLDLHECNVSN